MNYLDIANSSLMYILILFGIGFVLLQASVHLRMAIKRARDIGMDKSKIKTTIKSAATFSIVPTLPIIVALMTLIPVFGTPWPWFRLSVVGSASYELMAADLAAKGSGTSLAQGLNPEAFGNAIIVMTLAITWTFILNFFLVKRILGRVNKMKTSTNIERATILISCLTLSLLVVFIAPMITSNIVTISTLIASIVLTIIQSELIKRKNLEWLKGFQMSFSMIGAMIVAVITANLI